MKKMLKMIWRLYKSGSIILSTFIILLYSYGIINHIFSYLELPNGLRLTKSILRDTGDDGFILKDKDNNFILTAKGGEIAYQGDFVFGIGNKIISKDKTGGSFIYKSDWGEPMIFNGNDYSATLKQYNLSGSIELPPNIFDRESYKKCIKEYGTSKCDFKAYDEYWHNIEAGKDGRYKCKKDPKRACHSYVIYKTYLSLKEIPEFRRNWYNK